MELPSHIQAALGVASPIAEDALTVAADAWPITRSAFGLLGEEFTKAIVDAQASGLVISISQPPRINKTNWKYLELSNQGAFVAWSLTIPNNESVPPTEVGKALVKAWVSQPALLVNGKISSELLVRGIIPGASYSDFAIRFANEWADVCFMLGNAPVPPSWVSKSEIEILVNTRLTSAPVTNLRYAHLFLEAISEFKNKWRFLSLYRILEHGYLDEIFQTLGVAFFSSPKDSLTAASKSVENELQQFLALAEKAVLQNQFATLFDEFENSKAGGNQFALALDRSINQTGNARTLNDKWQKGVLICYKIRCAIVHAGLSAPIFDAYSDGPILLEGILPTFESISLNFLGVSIV